MEEELHGSAHRQKSPGTVHSDPGVPDPALQLEGVSLQLQHAAAQASGERWLDWLSSCTTQQVPNM